MSSRHDAKVVILGASGVGKTCLGLRFVKDQFVAYTASTIGASFLVKEVSIGNQKITLQIWDTAGQERFRSMAPLYYRGAVAAILVFSITDEVCRPSQTPRVFGRCYPPACIASLCTRPWQASFAKLQEWVRELQKNVEEPLVLAIACNKADMTAQRVVSYDTASQYAASIGALIFETSAKSDTGAHRTARRPCTRSGHRRLLWLSPLAADEHPHAAPRCLATLSRGGAAAGEHQVPPPRRRGGGHACAARPVSTAL